MNQTELRGAFALAFIYLMRMLGLFMVMPVLAVLTVDYPDYSPIWVGIAIGAYGLSQALLQIPMGMWSDKIGRKPVIVVGLLLFAIGSLLAAFADSMLMLTLGRILQGTGAIAGAVMALAADVSRENQRNKVMAIIGIAIGFSFYLALILGPIIASEYGLQGVFLLTAMLAIACIPMVIFVVPTAVTSAPRGDTLPNALILKGIVKSPTLLRLNISVMLLHMMITLVFVQFPATLQNLNWPIESHWLVYLPILVAAIIGMALMMGFARKVALNRMLMLSVLMMLLAFLGLAKSQTNFALLMTFIILFFTAFNYLEANLPALVANISAPGQKGSAMGIYASFQFFGAFLGGLVSGLIIAYMGSEVVYYLAAVVCLLWCFLFVKFSNTERLKRVTLSLNLAGRNVDNIAAQFKNLNGISEFTIVPDEAAVYLKVQGKQFDIIKARNIADPS